MIVDSPDSSFWQAVYGCAQEWAKKNDAILELQESSNDNDYTKLDYMNMSIASSVDGIILQYNGEQGWKQRSTKRFRREFLLSLSWETQFTVNARASSV